MHTPSKIDYFLARDSRKKIGQLEKKFNNNRIYFEYHTRHFDNAVQIGFINNDTNVMFLNINAKHNTYFKTLTAWAKSKKMVIKHYVNRQHIKGEGVI